MSCFEHLIKRGTTATLGFNLPYNPAEIQAVCVAFAQNGQEIFSKEDVAYKQESLIVSLSQEETLLFLPGVASVDVRLKLTNGAVPGTYIYPFYVIGTNKGGVL